MKKSYILAGVVILAIALGLIVYLNMKGPSKGATGSDTTVSTQEDGHGSDTHGHEVGHDKDHAQGGLGEIVKPGDPKNQALENVVVNSRIAEEFRFLDEQMEAQYERLKQSGASPEELAIFERLHAQLKGDDLLNQFRNVLKDKFSEAQLVQISEAYQDPAVVKYKETEAATRTPEGGKDFLEFSKTFKFENLPAERQTALKEFVKASGSVENMTKMMDNVGVIFGGGTGNAPDAKMNDMFRKTLETTMIVAAARNLKDSDVSQINHLAQVMGNPLVRASEEAKTEFVGETLVKVVKPEVEQAAAKAQK